MSELPSVTIATDSEADRFELADSMEAAAAKLWPMLVRIPYLGEPNRNGSHSHGSVFWRRMTEEHLVALLAALPGEQRERVLSALPPETWICKPGEQSTAALQREHEQERSRLRRAKAVIRALVERGRDHGDCYLCQIEEGEGASAGEYFHDAACPLVVQGFLTLAGYPVEPSPEKPDGEAAK